METPSAWNPGTRSPSPGESPELAARDGIPNHHVSTRAGGSGFSHRLHGLEGADDGNPGASWHGDLLPHRQRDLACKSGCVQIVHRTRIDENLDLTSSLQGECPFDPGEAGGNLLDGVHPADMGLQGISTCSWAGRRDCIGSLDDEIRDAHGLNLIVVSCNGMHDLIGFPMASCQFGTDGRVGSPNPRGEGLTEIVQEGRTTTGVDVATDFGCQGGRESGALDAVIEHLLAVGGPEAQRPEDGEEPIVNVADPGFGQRLGRGFQAHLFDVVDGSLMSLLDADGVDATVFDQIYESLSGHLAPHGVEAAQQDDARSVIDEDRDSRHLLEGADVAAFSPDDATLHLVAGQWNDADDGVGNHLGGTPLNGISHDVPSFALGVRRRLGDDRPGTVFSHRTRLSAEVLCQFVLGLAKGHPGDALQLRDNLLVTSIELGVPLVEVGAALRQLQALPLELVEAVVEVATGFAQLTITLCQLFGRALVDLKQGLGAVASLLGMIGSTLFISEPHSTGLERSASCLGLVTTVRKILSRTHQALLAAG